MKQSHFLPVASRCENDNTVTVKQDTLDLEVGAQRRRAQTILGRKHRTAELIVDGEDGEDKSQCEGQKECNS